MGGITASSGGQNVESGDLLSLQASMKKDPSGYEQELLLQLRHFDACVSVLLLKSSSAGQSLSGPSSTVGDAGAAKEVADVAMFLAHLGPFYPQYLKDLPQKLLQVLDLHESLPQILRRSLTQAVILTRNRKLVELVEILPVLMKLQCTGDRVVRKIAFMHVVHDIRRMNLKHKNEPCNRKLQNILFNLVQGDDEVQSKRALIVLAELYRRKVWIDERTANVICTACLHKSSRIMIASLRFLLGHDQQKDEDEGEDSDSDGEESGKPSVSVNREAIYKAYHKGTPASKKKKQNKLQRAIQSMQKQQRAEARETVQGSHVPLQHVVDPQVRC
jgi:protein SDA1